MYEVTIKLIYTAEGKVKIELPNFPDEIRGSNTLCSVNIKGRRFNISAVDYPDVQPDTLYLYGTVRERDNWGDNLICEKDYALNIIEAVKYPAVDDVLFNVQLIGE